MPSFKNLNSDDGLAQLNEYLVSRSYISGYKISSEDVALAQQVPHNVNGSKFPHVLRWYKHIRVQPEWVINNVGGLRPEAEEGEVKTSPKHKPQKNQTPKQKSQTPKQKPESPKQKPESPKAAAKKDDEDDDFTLEDDDSANTAQKLKEIAAKKEEEAKKAKKAAPVARSSIILDIKPEGLETDMDALEKQVRSITKEGLNWGAHQFVPVAFGIRKLRIIGIVVDDLISVDDLQEEIEKIEGVQSTDIHAFNKL